MHFHAGSFTKDSGDRSEKGTTESTALAEDNNTHKQTPSQEAKTYN